MILASIDSFLGSLWFGCLAFAVGYIVGNVFGFSRLFKVFNKD